MDPCMSRLHWTNWTLGIAVAGGLAAGILLTPAWIASGYISQIASPDPQTRAEAWTWLENPPPGGRSPRLVQWQLDIEQTLLQPEVQDAALLDAMEAMESRGRFGWSQTPTGLMVEVIGALERSGGDHMITAADLRASAPSGVLLPKTVRQATMSP